MLLLIGILLFSERRIVIITVQDIWEKLDMMMVLKQRKVDTLGILYV